MASVLLTDGGGDVGKAVICKSHLTTEPVLASCGSSGCKTLTRYSAYTVTLLQHRPTFLFYAPVLRVDVGRTCLQSRVWLLQILNRAQAFLGLTFTVQRIQQIKAAPFVFSLNNSFEFEQTDLENVLQIKKETYFYI